MERAGQALQTRQWARAAPALHGGRALDRPARERLRGLLPAPDRSRPEGAQCLAGRHAPNADRGLSFAAFHRALRPGEGGRAGGPASAPTFAGLLTNSMASTFAYTQDISRWIP